MLDDSPRIALGLKLIGRRCLVFASENVERDVGLVADDPAVVARRDIEEVACLPGAARCRRPSLIITPRFLARRVCTREEWLSV